MLIKEEVAGIARTACQLLSEIVPLPIRKRTAKVSPFLSGANSAFGKFLNTLAAHVLVCCGRAAAHEVMIEEMGKRIERLERRLSGDRNA